MAANKLGYPDGIYQYIFYTALLVHPIHIACAFYCQIYHCACMGIALYITSLNYWRLPTMPSFRRTVDMICAKTCILYHLYITFYCRNKWITMVPILLGMCCYAFSLLLYKQGFVWYAAHFHILLHVLVSMGASFTYLQFKS